MTGQGGTWLCAMDEIASVLEGAVLDGLAARSRLARRLERQAQAEGLRVFCNGFEDATLARLLAEAGIDAAKPVVLTTGGALHLTTGPEEHAIVRFDGIPDAPVAAIHLIASFPSNVESNFYLEVTGREDATLRFANGSVTLVNNASVARMDTEPAALFSLLLTGQGAYLFVNGVLTKRYHSEGGQASALVLRLVGHESADLSALVHGLGIWVGSRVRSGLDDALTSRATAYFDDLIAAGDLAAVHSWLRSFDTEVPPGAISRLVELAEAQFQGGGGVPDWLMNELARNLPPEHRERLRSAWEDRMPPPSVEVEDLAVRFYRQPNRRLAFSHLVLRKPLDAFLVLRDVAFRAYPGDIVGVIGANGAGKSTLLRAISGLIPISAGRITVRGRHLLLSPGLGIRNELSGKDNIFLACCFMGLTLSDTRELYDEIVDFSELTESIDQPFKYYSDGMKSRLIFSIATAVAPEILMLDELLNAGDIRFQKKATERMDGLLERTKVVVVVTHSIPFVLEKCTKAVLINNGRQLAYGDPEEVVSRYLEELHLDKEVGMGGETDNVATMQQIAQQSFLPSGGFS